MKNHLRLHDDSAAPVRPLARLRVLACAVLAASLAACASVQIGSPFDAKAFQTNVQRGVTTRAQVEAWLGAPTSKGVAVDTNGQRYDEWTYYYGEGQLPRLSGATLRILQVKFDADGIVRAYNWSGQP